MKFINLRDIFHLGNKRQKPRFRARKEVSCDIRQQDWDDFKTVFLVNVSASGCAVFVRSCDLEIQHEVALSFAIDQNETLETAGKVVGQTVYYPSGRQDLKEAMYRFSITFDKPLSTHEIELLKNPES